MLSLSQRIEQLGYELCPGADPMCGGDEWPAVVVFLMDQDRSDNRK